MTAIYEQCVQRLYHVECMLVSKSSGNIKIIRRYNVSVANRARDKENIFFFLLIYIATKNIAQHSTYHIEKVDGA